MNKLFRCGTLILVIGMVSSFVYASSLDNNVYGSNVNVYINTTVYGKDVGIYINPETKTIEQLAIESRVSVHEIRQLNQRTLKNRRVIKQGEDVLLPTSSPLLLKNTAIQSNSKNVDIYVAETQKRFRSVNTSAMQLPLNDKKIVLKEKANSQEYKMTIELPELGKIENQDETKRATSKDIESYTAQGIQRLANKDINIRSQKEIAEYLQEQAKSRGENLVYSQIQSQLVKPIERSAEEFLSRFGTAKVNLSVDKKGKLKGSSLSLFSPWHDDGEMLTFSQVTIGDHDKRTIGNFGLGQRWDIADRTWLLGYNVFYDHDFTRHHSRLGLGTEAWSDYLKLAANFYTPLSKWRDSRDFDDYEERAARGFDVRAQAYLPTYPHLGGSLMYEQYFGDEVGLFGKDNLKKNPYAFTLGLDYTPIPLVTLKASHKKGQSKSDTRLDMTMNYRLGISLHEQIDPSKVQLARSLKGSRYDLVDRNNNIVLEYRQKKSSLELYLIDPQTGLLIKDELSVRENTTLDSVVKLERVKPLKVQDWKRRYTHQPFSDVIPTDNFVDPTGNTAGDRHPNSRTVSKDETWKVKIPAYSNIPEENDLYVRIHGVDSKDNIVQSNIIRLNILRGGRFKVGTIPVGSKRTTIRDSWKTGDFRLAGQSLIANIKDINDPYSFIDKNSYPTDYHSAPTHWVVVNVDTNTPYRVETDISLINDCLKIDPVTTSPVECVFIENLSPEDKQFTASSGTVIDYLNYNAKIYAIKDGNYKVSAVFDKPGLDTYRADVEADKAGIEFTIASNVQDIELDLSAGGSTPGLGIIDISTLTEKKYEITGSINVGTKIVLDAFYDDGQGNRVKFTEEELSRISFKWYLYGSSCGSVTYADPGLLVNATEASFDVMKNLDGMVKNGKVIPNKYQMQQNSKSLAQARRNPDGSIVSIGQSGGNLIDALGNPRNTTLYPASVCGDQMFKVRVVIE